MVKENEVPGVIQSHLREKQMQVQYFAILVGIWASYNSVLKATELLNVYRDKVLVPDPKLTLRHRRLIMRSDWLDLACGNFLMGVLVAIMIGASPIFLDFNNAKWMEIPFWYIVGIVDTVIVVMLVSAVLTTRQDWLEMKRYLATLPQEPPTNTTSP